MRWRAGTENLVAFTNPDRHLTPPPCLTPPLSENLSQSDLTSLEYAALAEKAARSPSASPEQKWQSCALTAFSVCS